MPKFITAYGKKEVHDLSCPETTRTIQSEKQNCDMNFILKKYLKTRTLDHVRQYQGEYGNYDPIEFQDAMNIVVQAKNMFESVPSDIRARFHNDPTEFMAFVNNPNNQEELYKLGLATRPLPPEPLIPVSVKLSQEDLDIIKNTPKNA